MHNLKKIKKLLPSERGFTIAEMLTAMGIFSLIIVLAGSFIIQGMKISAVIWEQLVTQNEGRKVIQQVVDDIRRTEDASNGDYAIAISTDYEFVFYANIDEDGLKERIHYWVEDGDTIFKKGVTKPTGNPLLYPEEDDRVVELAHNLVNRDEGNPVFVYYDETYIGGEDGLLESPVTISDVRVVRVQLELEKDPTESPVPLQIESTVHLRNLKEN